MSTTAHPKVSSPELLATGPDTSGYNALLRNAGEVLKQSSQKVSQLLRENAELEKRAAKADRFERYLDIAQRQQDMGTIAARQALQKVSSWTAQNIDPAELERRFSMARVDPSGLSSEENAEAGVDKTSSARHTDGMSPSGHSRDLDTELRDLQSLL